MPMPRARVSGHMWSPRLSCRLRDTSSRWISRMVTASGESEVLGKQPDLRKDPQRPPGNPGGLFVFQATFRIGGSTTMYAETNDWADPEVRDTGVAPALAKC